MTKRKFIHDYFSIPIDEDTQENYLIIFEIQNEKIIKSVNWVKYPKLYLQFPRNPFLLN
jgi:hypothetical protein